MVVCSVQIVGNVEVRSIEFVSAVIDAAGQPGIRARGLVRRDPAVDDPRADAASIISEAAADRVQFPAVQFLKLSIVALSHVCLPLLKEGIIPAQPVVAGNSRVVRCGKRAS
jgi:hypothetical protein